MPILIRNGEILTDGSSVFTIAAAGLGLLEQRTVDPDPSLARTYTPSTGYDGFSQFTVNPIPSNYLIPTGTLNIVSNNTYDISTYSNVIVNVPTGSTIKNQNKTISLSTIPQSITFDVDSNNYTGLGTVTISAVPSNYIDTTVDPKDSSNLTVNGNIVTAAAGYYPSSASATVSAITHPDPSISINITNGLITATHQQTTGYVTGGTTTKTSQLNTINGTTITPTSLEQTLVAANYYTLGALKVAAVPIDTNFTTITSNGTYTAATGKYLTSVQVNVPTSSTIKNQNKTVTPTESQQTVTYDVDSNNYTGLGTVTVGAISSTYVGSGITQRSSTDLTASGATVTAPVGYYSAAATYTIPSKDLGSGNITLSLDSTTGVVSAYASISSSQAGYYGAQTTGDKTLQLTLRDSDDLTVSGDTITAPAGYYSTAASKSVSSMTLPTAASSSITSGYTSKATISRSASDQYINIPPGYNSAGGYYKISAVANGSVTAPATISGTSATLSTGTGTLTLTKTVSVTPSVTTAGYISSGTAGNSEISLTASVTINPTPTASGATVTIPAGYYSSQTTKSVSTMTLPTAASSTSSGTSKATIGRSTSNQYINIPVGYNSTAAYYTISAVANGSATGPSSLSGTSATVSTGTNTLTLTKTGVTTTPTVTAGYVSSATASTATVSLTASVTTKAAATYYPSTSDQTISASQYLTGAQTIKAVVVSGLDASKILSGTTVNIGDSADADRITSVSGNVSFVTYYTGSSAPSSSLGSNGDIYLQS